MCSTVYKVSKTERYRIFLAIIVSLASLISVCILILSIIKGDNKFSTDMLIGIAVLILFTVLFAISSVKLYKDRIKQLEYFEEINDVTLKVIKSIVRQTIRHEGACIKQTEVILESPNLGTLSFLLHGNKSNIKYVKCKLDNNRRIINIIKLIK